MKGKRAGKLRRRKKRGKNGVGREKEGEFEGVFVPSSQEENEANALVFGNPINVI